MKLHYIVSLTSPTKAFLVYHKLVGLIGFHGGPAEGQKSRDNSCLLTKASALLAESVHIQLNAALY